MIMKNRLVPPKLVLIVQPHLLAFDYLIVSMTSRLVLHFVVYIFTHKLRKVQKNFRPNHTVQK
jgi:hypothetical protein